MYEVKLHDATELDFLAFSSLQKQSFAQLLTDVKISDDFMSPDFFRWKYNPPIKTAKIAVVYEGKEMVASNAMMPCEVSSKNEKITGWQSCDTATLPKARGKGCFLKCLHLLKSSIDKNDVFFGFPNKNSTHGFYKSGCRPIVDVPTWLSPVSFLLARKSSHISTITRFDKHQDIFAQTYSHKSTPMVYRDSQYLNWRYTSHPKHSYTLFNYVKNGRYLGYAVVRQASIMGRNFCLVMEKLGETPSIERELLRHINHWAVKQHMWHSLTMDTCLPLWSGILSGYFPVPQKIAPKKQVLMAQAMGGALADTICENPWRAQLGDWDAF